MLHYLSEDPAFMAQSKNQCSKVIQQYSNDAVLDLPRLLNFASGSTFLSSSVFYKNLYDFNIAMINHISQPTALANVNRETVYKLLINLRNFIKKTLDYLDNYMTQYQVIDDKLIDSSYNLLYLFNILTFKQADARKGIAQLQEVYKRLVDTIMENLRIYKSLDTQKIYDLKIDRQSSDEIAALIAELSSRLDILNAQSTKLQENVNLINENTNRLSEHASTTVKAIGDNLQATL
jgi:methyl-accepting chemotaxis protein